MNRLRVSRLRRQHGLSDTQARLIAELFFEGAKNGR